MAMAKESEADSDYEKQELRDSSSLYREYQAERDEILRHKWLESEKAGYDVGFEYALTDWIMNHRAKWRRERKARKRSTATESSHE